MTPKLAFVAIATLLVLVACDKPKEAAVKSYKSVEECRADIAPDTAAEQKEKISTDCQTAFDKAQTEQVAQAPHYATLGECVDRYGSTSCGLSPSGGFYPFMAGFMLGYAAGVPVYQPYYYDRWGVAYRGSSSIGYYRGGYVMVPPGSSITRTYVSTTIVKGSVPTPAITSMRGGLGSSVSSAKSSGGTSSSSAVSSGSSSSARGGFGASAAASSSGGGE